MKLINYELDSWHFNLSKSESIYACRPGVPFEQLGATGKMEGVSLLDLFCTESSKVCHLIIPRPSELGNGGRDWEPDHEERYRQRGHRWRDDQDPQLLPRRNNRGGKHKYFSILEIEHVLILQTQMLFIFKTWASSFFADPLHGEARCEL